MQRSCDPFRPDHPVARVHANKVENVSGEGTYCPQVDVEGDRDPKEQQGTNRACDRTQRCVRAGRIVGTLGSDDCNDDGRHQRNCSDEFGHKNNEPNVTVVRAIDNELQAVDKEERENPTPATSDANTKPARKKARRPTKLATRSMKCLLSFRDIGNGTEVVVDQVEG